MATINLAAILLDNRNMKCLKVCFEIKAFFFKSISGLPGVSLFLPQAVLSTLIFV